MILALLASEIFSPRKIVLRKENAAFDRGKIINWTPSTFAAIPVDFNFAILYNFQSKKAVLKSIPTNHIYHTPGSQAKVVPVIVSALVPMTTVGK